MVKLEEKYVTLGEELETLGWQPPDGVVSPMEDDGGDDDRKLRLGQAFFLEVHQALKGRVCEDGKVRQGKEYLVRWVWLRCAQTS